MRSLVYARDDNSLGIISSFVMLSLVEASLFLHLLLIGCSEITLCYAFPLRCNVTPLLFGICIVCIAILVEVALWLQILRPYRAGSVVRGIDLTPSPLLTGEGRAVKVSPLRGDLEGSSRLNVENGLTPALYPEKEWSGKSKQWHKSQTR